MEIKSEAIEAVIQEALSRYTGARAKYGPLDLETDQRDFLLETEQELLDSINYAVFELETQEVKTMQVYRCVRCGNLHDFALQAEGRLCDRCGAPLTYHGQEFSPWGEHPMRDYDMTA